MRPTSVVKASRKKVDCAPRAGSKMVMGPQKLPHMRKRYLFQFMRTAECNRILQIRYIVTFLEASTRRATIYLSNKKTLSTNKRAETVHGQFKEFKNFFERQNVIVSYIVKLCRLQTDCGTEYVNEHF